MQLLDQSHKLTKFCIFDIFEIEFLLDAMDRYKSPGRRVNFAGFRQKFPIVQGLYIGSANRKFNILLFPWPRGGVVANDWYITNREVCNTL